MGSSGDKLTKAELRYIRILEELSKGDPSRPVKLAEVGRRLGISRQLVHKYVKDLAKEGYVEKVGRHYVLSNRGKALLELVSEASEMIKEMIKQYIEDIRDVKLPLVYSSLEKKKRKVGAGIVYMTLMGIAAYFLSTLFDVVQVIDPKTKDRVLDDIWREKLKKQVEVASDILQLSGIKGLEALGTTVHWLFMVAIFNLVAERVNVVKETTAQILSRHLLDIFY